MTFQKFLSGIPARDYIFQKEPYEQQIGKAAELIEGADYILIGAGAGLSTAAGAKYGGEFFKENFAEFIKRYGQGPYMRDMYGAGFYPYPTQEEKWGYWSKMALKACIELPEFDLYKKLYELVKEKEYFVLTTNVDEQFRRTGFEAEKIFATQGSYERIQCKKGCHNKTYNGAKMFKQMDQARCDCKIPTYMVPKCPVCGGDMEMNLRSDRYFVEDESWHKAEKAFSQFLKKSLGSGKNVLLICLGTGFNTPTIIRFPFEKLVRENRNVSLLRLNLDEAVVEKNYEDREIGINADMAQSIPDILKKVQDKKKLDGSEMGKAEMKAQNKEEVQDETETQNRVEMQAEMKMQKERLDYLLDEFKVDSVTYKDLEVDEDYESKRITLRSLMNIRMPKKMSEEVIKVQDEFLREEAKEKGIVSIDEIETVKEKYNSSHQFADKISIWQGDITRLKTDAIVNAANSQMLGCFVPCHRCIDNAIHSAAGIMLREECNHRMRQKKMIFGNDYQEPTGQAMITKGYNLLAKYVIHTVGPIVAGRLDDSLRNDLKNCYKSVLACCVENKIRSVAFCCISTGEFRFPNDEAAKIAVETVSEFLESHESDFDRIIFNVFKDIDLKLYENYF